MQLEEYRYSLGAVIKLCPGFKHRFLGNSVPRGILPTQFVSQAVETFNVPTVLKNLVVMLD